MLGGKMYVVQHLFGSGPRAALGSVPKNASNTVGIRPLSGAQAVRLAPLRGGA